MKNIFLKVVLLSALGIFGFAGVVAADAAADAELTKQCTDRKGTFAVNKETGQGVCTPSQKETTCTTKKLGKWEKIKGTYSCTVGQQVIDREKTKGTFAVNKETGQGVCSPSRDETACTTKKLGKWEPQTNGQYDCTVGQQVTDCTKKKGTFAVNEETGQGVCSPSQKETTCTTKQGGTWEEIKGQYGCNAPLFDECRAEGGTFTKDPENSWICISKNGSVKGEKKK